MPAAKRKSEKAKALTDMQKFVKPYAGDADPITTFESEFRRTLGRIAWYDDQLSRLASADDLIFGLTKEEQISAAEFPGTNSTYEARSHMLNELQFRERKHLLDLEKVWIGAKLDTERLNLMKRYVEGTYSRILNALERLGLDANDPKVRDTLALALTEDRAVDANEVNVPVLEAEVTGE
ncbi:MAG: hypothetical protein ACRDQA_26685 [Nocardioidaceae bacterium]